MERWSTSQQVSSLMFSYGYSAACKLALPLYNLLDWEVMCIGIQPLVLLSTAFECPVCHDGHEYITASDAYQSFGCSQVLQQV